MDRTLIVGLGNRLMTDDAVGLEALRAFVERYELPEGVDLLDGGTQGLGLLAQMEGYRRVLIADCVAAGHEPGTLLRVDGEDVPRVFSRCLSPHQVGLKDLVAVLVLQGRMPDALTVLGVEPESVELGLELSAPVAGTLPRLVDAMAAELAAWGHPPRPRTVD